MYFFKAEMKDFVKMDVIEKYYNRLIETLDRIKALTEDNRTDEAEELTAYYLFILKPLLPKLEMLN